MWSEGPPKSHVNWSWQKILTVPFWTADAVQNGLAGGRLTTGGSSRAAASPSTKRWLRASSRAQERPASRLLANGASLPPGAPLASALASTQGTLATGKRAGWSPLLTARELLLPAELKPHRAPAGLPALLRQSLMRQQVTTADTGRSWLGNKRPQNWEPSALRAVAPPLLHSTVMLGAPSTRSPEAQGEDTWGWQCFPYSHRPSHSLPSYLHFSRGVQASPTLFSSVALQGFPEVPACSQKLLTRLWGRLVLDISILKRFTL